MDDTPVPKSNYALQLALQTMKDRCIQLQKRVTILQEENLTLKSSELARIHEHVSHNSLEIRVSKLTEERNQLKNTISMVAAENKQLWSSLSRITNESKSYGMKHSQITDNLIPNEKAHMPLIRSRTFTQEAPHTKHLQKVLSVTDKVSLELEDISLKLEKNDIDDNIEQDMEVQEIDVSIEDDSLHSLGFNYLEDDVDDSINDCFEQHLMDLKNIKLILSQHHDVLRKSVDSVKDYKLQVENNKENLEKKRAANSATKMIQVNIEDEEKAEKEKNNENNKVSGQQDWGTPDSSLKLDKNMDKICPMCSKRFHLDVDFDAFTRHVEEHFMENDVLRL